MVFDRPLVGIALMLGFCVLAPLGDSIAKLLGSRFDVLHLLVVRFAFQAAILVPLLWFTGRKITTNARITRITAMRTVLHIIGIGAMFTSLKYLPIADAIAIAFVMPFILLLLGKFFLGEEVGPHRLGAAVVGFGGTLLIIQPNFAEVGPPALLPLVVAVVFALFMLVTRTIAKEVDAVSLQAQSGVMAIIVLVPIAIAGSMGDFIASPPVPGGRDLGLLLVLGTVGTLGHLLMTWSLRFAPAATLAPMQYLEIPVATVFGWLIFSDLPNGLASIGIFVTIAAGLYVVWREHVTSAKVHPSPGEEPSAS